MTHELVEVFHGGSYAEARIIEGLLAGEGLHPVVPGSELTDEFGMMQKLGGMASAVLVPESQVEAAKKILAVWRESQPSDLEQES